MWYDIRSIGGSIQERWLLCGDFNNVLSIDNRQGQPVTDHEIKGFKEMLDNLQLIPLRSKGSYFTWTNKQQGANRVYSKIDWVFGNFEWIQRFSRVEVDFLSPVVSDHSPALIQCLKKTCLHPKPFRLYATVM